MITTPRPLAAAALAALVLCGCATTQPPLYQWGGYQAALYQHLNANGADSAPQIAKLEEQVQKTEAAHAATPPGLHGHLALLYSRAGDDASARRHLEAERTKFPESAAYVDFLLKNASRDASKATVAAPAASAASAKL